MGNDNNQTKILDLLACMTLIFIKIPLNLKLHGIYWHDEKLGTIIKKNDNNFKEESHRKNLPKQ